MIAAQTVTMVSSRGNRVSQEDFSLADREKGIFVIADGFGGPQAGANAAKRACEATRDFLLKEGGDTEATLPFVIRNYFSLVGNVLFNSIVYANKELLSMNKKKNVHEKGGASLLAAYLDDDLLALASVGNCQGLIIRGDAMRDLVTPRSYSMLHELAPSSAFKDVPLMAVGIETDLEPEIVEFKIHAGDWLALYTDGIGPKFKSGLMAIKQARLGEKELKMQLEQLVTGCVDQDNGSILLAAF